jgi:vacuolar-type H+-ATPase subunit C/Vma6
VQDALLLAGGPRDAEAGPAFIEGGRWLSREAFLSIARATARPAALALVREALARSPLARLFPTGSDDAVRADRALLVAWLGRAHREARLEPLGSAPLLDFLLRLEAQSRDLRAVAWGAVLQAPPVLRKQELVTPWS